jgi:hypothetical protein
VQKNEEGGFEIKNYPVKDIKFEKQAQHFDAEENE